MQQQYTYNLQIRYMIRVLHCKSWTLTALRATVHGALRTARPCHQKHHAPPARPASAERAKKREAQKAPPKRQNATKNAVKLRLPKSALVASASIAAPISGHEGYIFFKRVFINSRVNYSGVRGYQTRSFRSYSGRYLGIPRVYTRVSREHIPGYPESRYPTKQLNTHPSKTSVLAGWTSSAVENNVVLQSVGQSSVDFSL